MEDKRKPGEDPGKHGGAAGTLLAGKRKQVKEEAYGKLGLNPPLPKGAISKHPH